MVVLEVLYILGEEQMIVIESEDLEVCLEIFFQKAFFWGRRILVF